MSSPRPALDPWRWSIRARLFALSIAVVCTGLLAVVGYASWALERDVAARTRDELAERTALAAEAVRAAGALDATQTDALVRRLARSSGARVTLIDPRGRVEADSSVPLERVGTLSDHGARPEVRAAFALDRGAAERRSATVYEDLLYAARRVERDDGRRLVVRLAVRPALVEVRHASLRRFLLSGAAAGLLVSALLAALAVQQLTRPLAALTRVARAMRSDLSVRARSGRHDELGALARALDELADELATTLASLRSERDRLQAILEAMVEGVLVLDAQGKVLLANRALREMFLVGREVVGQSPREALESDELDEALERAVREHAAVSCEVAVTGVRPRRLAVSAAPLAEGRAAVAVLSDVTELRRLETVRRDFVANVSHELRTPIAAVRAAVETLEAGAVAEPAAAAEFLSIIARHSERLHRLVEDLLNLSRIEAKELRLALRPLAVAPAVAHALELFVLAADKKRLRLRADVAPEVPAALADASALEHVLTNLIDNAIKYAPEGSTLTARARRHDTDDGARVRVSVIDAGPGIEPRHLPRVFERFYRIDAGRSRQLGGTGLGLAIAKHLAEAMRGTISVESAPGAGTSFHVDLRLGDEAAAESFASP